MKVSESCPVQGCHGYLCSMFTCSKTFHKTFQTVTPSPDSSIADWINIAFLYTLWFNFILGLNFISFFGGMVIYDDEFETKEKNY